MMKRRRRKCLNCGQLFRPDPRSARHQRYCSTPAPVATRARRRAKRAGCPNPRTGTTSAAPSIWPGFGHGGRPTRAMRDGAGVRYKRTPRRNSLIKLKKQAP